MGCRNHLIFMENPWRTFKCKPDFVERIASTSMQPVVCLFAKGLIFGGSAYI